LGGSKVDDLPDQSSTRRARVFLLVWFGQLISLVGSGLTSFSLSLWVFRRSGSTALYALLVLFAMLPGIMIAPFAGAWVDRWDRRKVMLISALIAGVFTMAMAGLLWLGTIQVWQIAIAVSGISICEAFQDPAHSASNTLLLTKETFARGNGLMQLANAIGFIASPLLAILLLGVIHIETIMVVDFLTYIFLIVVLLGVQIPSPRVDLAGRTRKASLLFEAASGWRYVRTRTGLMYLLGFFSIVIFAARMIQVLLVPLVLGMSSTRVLATVVAAAPAGMITGSIAMTIWGGFRRRIYSVYVSGVIVGLALIVTGMARSPAVVASALFLIGAVVAFGSASDQIIWQLKTRPDMQGRVFSFRRMVIAGCLPAACIVAGTLVDRVFRPLLMPNGLLAGTLGRYSGVGPARGAGLFLALIGLLTLIATIAFAFVPAVRMIESRLADAVTLDAPMSVCLPLAVGSLDELSTQSTDLKKEITMNQEDTIDSTIYRVVVNHEEQYSIWPAHKSNPRGWTDGGRTGPKAECLAYIKEVWIDMTPLSVRKSTVPKAV
jgi:uncharacterized protein YbdZ (MbtH family)/MFS family permease